MSLDLALFAAAAGDTKGRRKVKALRCHVRAFRREAITPSVAASPERKAP